MKVLVRKIGGLIRLDLRAESDSERVSLCDLIRALGGSISAIDRDARFRVESVGGEDLGADPDAITSIALEELRP